MASYNVDFSRKAAKELQRIDTRYIPKIIERAEGLADNPRPDGCRKLSGSENSYRIRVGNFRLIYEIEDDQLVVLVVKVRHRQSAYD